MKRFIILGIALMFLYSCEKPKKVVPAMIYLDGFAAFTLHYTTEIDGEETFYTKEINLRGTYPPKDSIVLQVDEGYLSNISAVDLEYSGNNGLKVSYILNGEEVLIKRYNK